MKIFLPISLFLAMAGGIAFAAPPAHMYSGGGYDGYDMLGVNNSAVSSMVYLYSGGGYDGYDMLGVNNSAVSSIVHLYSGGGYDGYDVLGATNTVANPIPGVIALSSGPLSFTATYNGADPGYQVFSVSNSGALAYGYTNSVTYGDGASGWLSVSAPTGSLEGTVSQTHTATVHIAGVNAGTYSATNAVTLLSGSATNSPQTLIVSLTVNKANQTVTFSLIGAQLTTNIVPLVATATSGGGVSFAVVSGPATITYTPATNVVFTGAGQVSIAASQGGDGNWNAAVPVTNTFTVTKVTPVITWSTPSPISYGTPLSDTQLNASSTTPPGTCAYTPASGTVPNPGSNVLQAVLSPTDSARYNTATSLVTIVVNPTISVTAGIHGTIVPGGTVTVPYGGATNFVVSGVDSSYLIRSLMTNGVPVSAAVGLHIYTSQWQNVFATGTITAAFDFIGRYSGGGYDGYDMLGVTNTTADPTRGSVYKIR